MALALPRAIETFVRAFAYTRSFTHPCHVHRVGRLWVMRDAPRKRPADCRREEWVACGVPPAEVDATARKESRGHFCISAILVTDQPDAPVRDAYKSLGYRLGTTESFMIHGLGRIPKVPEPFPVQRVRSQDLADRLAVAARYRQAMPEHLKPDSPLRQYAALDSEIPVGWARSITVGDATWVSNVYVIPKYRRRGIARAILAKMLRDDRAHGATQSVLLASHTGALLYTAVGYEPIGLLLLFTPSRR